MSKNFTDKLFANPKLYMKFRAPWLSDERTKQELQFLTRILKINKDQKVLDIPCGFGRHSILLAKKWCQVTGIDTNKYFIQEAKKRGKGSGAKYIQWDMLKLKYKAEFDVVINLFTSFGYFDDAANERVLQNFYNALKEGGKLVIDMINRDRIVQTYTKGIRKDYTMIDKDIMLEEESFDLLTGRLHNNKKFIIKNKEIHVPYSLRIYTYTEIRDLLQNVGFTVTGVYGDYRWSAYSLTSKRLIIMAQK